jgi:hypothetical protein
MVHSQTILLGGECVRLENKKLKTGILLIAALMVSSGIYAIWANVGTKNKGLAEANQEFSLVRPALAQSIVAATTFLGQEAGMSIWLNATADSPLNLLVAQNKMVSNLENVTSDCVIGSIPLADFSSDDYPHCFVHKSGWVIVYFLRINTQNPSTTGWLGKMMVLSDANYYAKGVLKNNILQKGLETVCAGLVQLTPTTYAKYYNFQYPNAAKLMIAIKEGVYNAEVTFNIQVPSGITIDERSWSSYGHASYGVTWKIDTTQIYSGVGRHYGGPEITAAVLPADGSWHTVTIYGSFAQVCILILYH